MFEMVVIASVYLVDHVRVNLEADNHNADEVVSLWKIIAHTHVSCLVTTVIYLNHHVYLLNT